MSRYPLWMALVLSCWVASAGRADSFTESFDQPGTDALGPTRFSVPLLAANTGVARDALEPGIGAPATGGLLPVDEGGDSELRFFEVSSPTGGSYALTSTTEFADLEISAVVGIGFTTAFGSRTASVLARASGTTIATLNAYSVSLQHSLPGTSAFLALGRIRNGIGQTLALSAPFPVAVGTENYRLVLHTEGTQLTARIDRLEVVAGELVVTPIDLDAAAGDQFLLVASDGELGVGAVGLGAFQRSTNQVFFDDVAVVDFGAVFADGFESGNVSAWSAATGFEGLQPSP